LQQRHMCGFDRLACRTFYLPVCVCVGEREREIEIERDRESKRSTQNIYRFSPVLRLCRPSFSSC
jgi:hypothetical protein